MGWGLHAPKTMNRLLITGAHVVDPSQGMDQVFSILIEDGKIKQIAENISGADDGEVIDGSGLHLFPGLVDIHTHLREPGREDKETIATGTRAAAAGGFTSVCPIPNTNPVIDSQTGLKFVLARAESEGVVNVYPFASVTKGQNGEEIVEFGDLVHNGAKGFTDDGRPVMNNEIMRRALEYSAMFNVPVLDHCEDSHMAHGGCIHEGDVSARLGLKGIPGVAESVQVARDVELAAFTGGHIHIMHVSKKESIEHIRHGKARGIKVTAEVTPHHLTLTDESVANFDTRAKVNPPMGAEEDRVALLEALLDGTIDCIATDHAPHTDIEKDMPINECPFGMIGLETAFPLLYTRLVKTGIMTLPFLIERMTAVPARIIHVDPRGTLAVGAPADITLVNLDEEFEVTREFFHSKSKNSPFIGTRFFGRVKRTIVNGKTVFADGKIIGD